MVHFSIGMFLSAVAAGPAHLERMLALLPAMSPIPGTWPSCPMDCSSLP